MNLTPKQTIKGTVAETQSLRGSMKDIPSLDNTLTKEGYAADAKAVGEVLESKAPISHTEDKGNPHGVTASQVGARPDTWMPSASEIGARPDDWMPTAEQVGAVPISRTVNGKSLGGDISLTASDVGARENTWMPTAEQVGARPNTWMPTAEDVGARPNTWTPASSDLLNAYPIGSIYMSVNATSPATLFGGTWEQLQDRFLLGAGSTYSNGATGGEATHTLTIDETPSHHHTTYSVGFPNPSSDPATAYTAMRSVNQSDLSPSGTSAAKTNNTGGGKAHNNMPPYLVVYMWKRTA